MEHLLRVRLRFVVHCSKRLSLHTFIFHQTNWLNPASCHRSIALPKRVNGRGEWYGHGSLMGFTAVLPHLQAQATL
jgi:hypothetical protein